MSKARILLVEDDTVIAKIAEWRLKNLGYELCGHAVTGEEAVSLVRKEKPDLILMDINLKGETDGIDTAVAIKNETKIPIVYVTSHSEGATIERAKATKPDGFILKPFEDNDLRIAIELALKR